MIQGELTIGQLGSCLDGSLMSLSYDSNEIVLLENDRRSIDFIVKLDRARTVDIEIGSLKQVIPRVTLLDDTAGVIAAGVVDTLGQRDSSRADKQHRAGGGKLHRPCREHARRRCVDSRRHRDAADSALPHPHC